LGAINKITENERTYGNPNFDELQKDGPDTLALLSRVMRSVSHFSISHFFLGSNKNQFIEGSRLARSSSSPGFWQ
jgi:hypothetical protein